MPKTLIRPVKVSDESHETIQLKPGDSVPKWAEKYVPDNWCKGTEQPAAGTDLHDDHVYQVVKQVAADERVEFEEDWSASQIAAAIRLKRRQIRLEQQGFEGEEVDEANKGAQDTMSKLFGTTNSAGNVNAPDRGRARATRGQESTGGADS